MTADELKTILAAHKLWRDSDGMTGKRANLTGAILTDANLAYADLTRADLTRADLTGANLTSANLTSANLTGAILTDANLAYADLTGANLTGANLTGADIDFAVWPLWCGSKGVRVDRRIAAQLAAHFCALDCDDADYRAARAAILEFAKTSHRAKDLDLAGDGAQ